MSTFQITAPHPLPRQGRYEIGGKRYVRVSTVIGMVAKPELVAWMERVGIDEARRIRTEAAIRGTVVHKVCEEIDNGQAPHVAAKMRPLIDAYLAWKDEHVGRVVMCEEVVYHRELGYAGTIDRLVRLNDGRTVIADLKTGTHLDWVIGLAQAAYAMALEAMGVRVDGRILLHMPWSGGGRLEVVELPDLDGDCAGFRACLTLYNLRVQRNREARQRQ